MSNNGIIVVPTGTDMEDPAAVKSALTYIPGSEMPGPFCDIPVNSFLYPVGSGFDFLAWLKKGAVDDVFAVPGTLGAMFLPQAPYFFEDSAASIPAAVGGPVGCVLDISTDSALPTRRNLFINSECNAGLASFAVKSAVGLEETTMGGFDAAIRVSRVDTITVVAYNTSAGAMTIGTTYTISAYVSMDDNAGPPVWGVTAGTDLILRIGASNATALPIVQVGPNLYRVSGVFTATSTSANHGVVKGPNTSDRSFKISGFQVEVGPEPTIYQKIVTGDIDLVPGNHAFMQTSALKPTLRQTPETGIYWLDSNAATSALVATFATPLGSNCTIAYVGPEGVVFLENQTIGTTYNIAPQFGFNSARLIVNRPLTDAEKALISRYLGRFVPTLGPELYQNPSFDTDTIWTKGATWTISDGNAITTAGASSNLMQPVGIAAGEQIFFTTVVTSIAGFGIYPTYMIGDIGPILDASGGPFPRTFSRVSVPSVGTVNSGIRAAGTSTNAVIASASLRRIL